MFRVFGTFGRLTSSKVSGNCRHFNTKKLQPIVTATYKSTENYGAYSVLAASFAICLLNYNERYCANCDANPPLGRNFVSDVVSKVGPSVVNIMTANKGGGYNGVSTGSGFIISKDGFIATNAHVVENSVDGKVLITFSNGEKRLGKIHSSDSTSDVAVVKLDERHNSLVLAKFGSSSKLRAGEFVVSIGSPMSLQNSSSFGIVSAVARHATELGMANNKAEYIQTDAACNTGNSGGPLVNMDGEVVGINTMTVEGSEGLSFAIPADIAQQILKQLMTKGRVDRPYVGLKMIPVLDGPVQKKRNRPDIFETRNTLVMVLEITPGSPAEKAGFKRGDVIAEVDGRPISVVRDVLECLKMDIGQTLKIRVRRPVERTPEKIIEIPVYLTLVTEQEPVEKK